MTVEDLYNQALVGLARDHSGAGQLEAPAGEATLDNPLCGDRVRMQVRLAGGRVLLLAHRVRGCVLCEASASLLGRAAPGCTAAELAAARQALEALLRHGAAAPEGSFGGLSAFAPVGPVPSRHSCVLLPFDALQAAIAGAREPS